MRGILAQQKKAYYATEARNKIKPNDGMQKRDNANAIHLVCCLVVLLHMNCSSCPFLVHTVGPTRSMRVCKKPKGTTHSHPYIVLPPPREMSLNITPSYLCPCCAHKEEGSPQHKTIAPLHTTEACPWCRLYDDRCRPSAHTRQFGGQRPLHVFL